MESEVPRDFLNTVSAQLVCAIFLFLSLIQQMEVDEKVCDHFNALLLDAANILSAKQNVRGMSAINGGQSAKWATRALSLIERVTGVESRYATNFKAEDSHYSRGGGMRIRLGVLEAAFDDYKQGGLFEIKTLVEAEMFDDLLDQATHLADKGYHPAGAVIAGCMLEDGLRKLCERNQIELPDKPQINSLSQALVKGEVINKLGAKKILAMADVRNSAAHGKWEEFNDEEAREMIKSVRSFIEKNFS